MQKELPKHYHNVNFLNIFQTQTFSKQLLLNRLLWNLVPKTAHFLGYILNLYVFSRLIISISRQITDIYPAPSSDYPALALIQLGSTPNLNLLYTEKRDYIEPLRSRTAKKSTDFQISFRRHLLVFRNKRYNNSADIDKKKANCKYFPSYTLYSSGLNYRRIAYNKHTPYPISNTRSRRREK